MFEQIVEYMGRLMAGGTLEIILLIVIIVVALILFIVLLWLLWKLAGLIGKGLFWLGTTGREKVQQRSAARRDARLAAPPTVAAGWSASRRIGLRRALVEARRLASPEALRIVVIAGEGAPSLFRGLGLTPPGAGAIGISAGGDTVLIDASGADSRLLGRLARALPWRRPIDGIATLVDPDGIPNEAIARATTLARNLGLRSALHFVFPGGEVAAWQIIDSRNSNGDAICSQLATDAARVWLTSGEREGLKDLALAQSREMPAALDRALAAAPSTVDIASLSLGGAGLRGAVAQTTDRTEPASVRSVTRWAGVAAAGAGAVLTVLAVVDAFDRAATLKDAVSAARREAAVPWVAAGIETIPSGGRVHRIAGTSLRLAESAGFSPLLPLAPLVPNGGAAGELGAGFLENYVLVPLADALRREAERRFAPTDRPMEWIEGAREVSEWLAAYEGLHDDPRDVDVPRLLMAAFGGDQTAWPEGTDLALTYTGARPPVIGRGGLDVARLTDLARESFVVTMQRWADSVYTNGPVAVAARQAVDRSSGWRVQHAALVDLRTALQDPAQQWLTASEDRPDYAFELRILGRAIALPLLGQVNALDAKASVSALRIQAREAAEYFILAGIGPLMVRSSSGGQGSGASLVLSRPVEAWFAFLDRLANAGFADLPLDSAALPLAGPATLDASVVSRTRNQLRVFDQFAANLPTELPPAIAQRLVAELGAEVVVGVTFEVEGALRSANVIGAATDHAERLVGIAPALGDLIEIEAWLRERLAENEANRVRAVRGRVAENILQTSAEALAEEDPLGLHIDPSADSRALARRFERGLTRLRRIYEQFAAPFLESDGGAQARWASADWRNIAADIAAYERGDGDSALSGLEGMVRAWAESEGTACEAPPAALVDGRQDYVARALGRFRVQVENACERTSLAESMRVYGLLTSYFNQYVAWQWPYARDEVATELPPSTLEAFVEQLHAGVGRLGDVEHPFAQSLIDSAGFWSVDDDGRVGVHFRVAWRAQPSDEQLAENIIAFELAGAQTDEDGTYIWRYGTPLILRMRLASNSKYEWVRATGGGGKELARSPPGNGAFLRLFEGLSNGAWAFESEVVDNIGSVRKLRTTARITHPDGRVMTMPQFSAYTHDAALGR